MYSHFTGASLFLSSNSFTFQFFSPLFFFSVLGGGIAMGMGADKLLCTLLLLLPVLGFSGALKEEWKPGNYVDNKEQAVKFLGDYNTMAEKVFFYSVSASWNYNTNITDHNSQLQVGHLLGS